MSQLLAGRELRTQHNERRGFREAVVFASHDSCFPHPGCDQALYFRGLNQSPLTLKIVGVRHTKSSPFILVVFVAGAEKSPTKVSFVFSCLFQ